MFDKSYFAWYSSLYNYIYRISSIIGYNIFNNKCKMWGFLSIRLIIFRISHFAVVEAGAIREAIPAWNTSSKKKKIIGQGVPNAKLHKNRCSKSARVNARQ